MMIQIHHVESVFECARTLHASPFSSVHQLFGQLLSITLAPVVLCRGKFSTRTVFLASLSCLACYLFGVLSVLVMFASSTSLHRQHMKAVPCTSLSLVFATLNIYLCITLPRRLWPGLWPGFWCQPCWVVLTVPASTSRVTACVL